MITMNSVPWHDIDDVWPDMEQYVQSAVDESHGTLTARAIQECIRDRDMQAMVAVDEDGEIVGVMVTEVLAAVSGVTYIYAVALAGDRFEEWRGQASDLLKQWATSMNAPFVLFQGRRGWVKRLADLGWREQSVVMALDLRN